MTEEIVDIIETPVEAPVVPTGEARRSRKRFAEPVKIWVPKTELGKAVKAEKFASIDDIWKAGHVIKESEIYDSLLKGLEEHTLKIGKGKRPFYWVQRMTDSGRRNKYFVMAAVGNKEGYVGLGMGRSKDYSIAISKAFRQARLHIIKVERGCGSWDCGCKTQHSISAQASGKSGSVKVTFKPAPKGTGIVANDISKDILELAGIKDVWSETNGHTKTKANLTFATFDALKNLNKIKTGVKA